jgi:hypothetical protein
MRVSPGVGRMDGGERALVVAHADKERVVHLARLLGGCELLRDRGHWKPWIGDAQRPTTGIRASAAASPGAGISSEEGRRVAPLDPPELTARQVGANVNLSWRATGEDLAFYECFRRPGSGAWVKVGAFVARGDHVQGSSTAEGTL